MLGCKIVVFTGLLEHFRTDAVATIIGHEVYPLYTCLYCQSQIVVYDAGFS
jgi:hypothetical protein